MHVLRRFRLLLLIPLLAVVDVRTVEAQPQGKPGNARQSPPQAPDRAFLGAYTELLDPQQEDSGLKVTFTYPHSTAREIGLLVGDEIVALNNVLIKNRKSFVAELRNNNVGGTVRFIVRRDAKKVKLKGKIKGYRKTMGRIQVDLRKGILGKRLPEQPPMLLWDPEAKKLVESKNALGHLAGKIGLVVWYDDCSYCQKKRFDFLAGLHLRSKSSPGSFPLGFTGLYYSDQLRDTSAKANLEGAVSLYTTKRPAFPAGVVHYSDSKPEPAQRYESLYIFNHGVAILEPDGKVAYLQVFGAPDERAIQSALVKVFAKHFQKKPDARKASAGSAPPSKAPPTESAGN